MAVVTSRLSQAATSCRPSTGGSAARVPVATTTAFAARSRRVEPSARVTSTCRSPVSRPFPRTSSTWMLSTQLACGPSSRWLMKSSRRSSTACTSTSPVTAWAAPGSRRAAARACSGTSSALLGMQAQYEHSPPTRSDSTKATDSPLSRAYQATLVPVEPAPSTITSKSSSISSSLSLVGRIRRRQCQHGRAQVRSWQPLMPWQSARARAGVQRGAEAVANHVRPPTGET